MNNMMPPIETRYGSMRRPAPTLREAIAQIDDEIMRHNRAAMLNGDLRAYSEEAARALRLAKGILEQREDEIRRQMLESSNIPSFTEWLRKYALDDTPGGDFARRVAGDCEFPSSSSLPVLEWYLRGNGAHEDSLDFLRVAFRMYEKENAVLRGEVSQ